MVPPSHPAEIANFVPGPSADKELRGVFSRFATGVTVITTMTDQGPLGMTVNSFSSVSLDPALVLWSADRRSRRFDAFHDARHTAIHVLSKSQEHFCHGFAANGWIEDGITWQPSADGVPLIDGCIARFECTRFTEFSAGDHAIFVARVDQAMSAPGEPLIFYRGAFGNFSA